MKKIVSWLLVALMVCLCFSGCGQSGSTASSESAAPSESTVSPERVDPSSTEGIYHATETLENLFTTVDLMDITLEDLQTELSEGHVTSEKLTQMYIDRIEEYDKALGLNSILFINPAALDDARELDRERSEGTVRGPLHGIPIVVKANIDVAGMPTSAGSNTLAGMIAEEDAFVVRKLKEAGAVILAQANMSEFAYGAVHSQSTLGGNVHNAYDTAKTPGGSSGGNAVAVTCNFAAAGVGTDTGGSIRNPSSFSNIYGLKPSKGLISTNGILPLKTYRDTAGPMGRTVEDIALLLGVLAGTDEADDYTVEADADTMLGDGYTANLTDFTLEDIRIGYLDFSFEYTSVTEEESIYENPSDRTRQLYKNVIANFVKGGAEFVDMSEYLTKDMIEDMFENVSAETFEYDLNKFLNDKGDAAPYKTVKELKEAGHIMFLNLGMLTLEQEELAGSFKETENPYITIGSYQRIPEWKKVLNNRAKILKIMEENDIDAIMYLNFFDAPQNESFIMEPHYNEAGYDVIFGSNFGLPDINLPMGFSEPDESCASRLPLGVSLFSAYGQDEKLLQIAYAYEQQAGRLIRMMPETTPALEDKELNAFLEDLIDRAYSIDYSKFDSKPEGKVQLMLNACEKAMNVDTKDPDATYEAARVLAEAYDKVMAELNK